jgi:hypothetical protein
MKYDDGLFVIVSGRCNVHPAITTARNQNTKYKGVGEDVGYGVYGLGTSAITRGSIAS